ncbi:MAG: deoxyribodipyrimidine photolyase [Deltaproteobacteria bacterium]|nr:deoxyribodipyrimidine photolyase [Deltaproteobacteria bacterium]
MWPVPALRLRGANQAPVNPRGDYVLYWMTAARRLGWNYGLARAVEACREFGRPLLVLEALRAAYLHASPRLSAFALEGMAVNARALAARGVSALAYVEPVAGEGKGQLAALAARAVLVVADEFPAFFLPRMLAAAARQVPVRLEVVDSGGLLPLAAAPRAFRAAVHFRRWAQGELPRHLASPPPADPLAAYQGGPAEIPGEVLRRWPPTPAERLGRAALAGLPLPTSPAPVAGVRGGEDAATARLSAFLATGLDAYHQERNQPRPGATSGLSPYLHWGHLSPWAVLDALLSREGRRLDTMSFPRPTGQREGWWGLSPGAEAFLEQLVTWRELGFNFCRFHPGDYAAYDSLPAWARETLAAHAADRREHVYAPAELEAAATHDPVWNAAQGQLLREGMIYGYLRMLWGKKILEWSASPATAWEVLVQLNDKYALDGRDPNSYNGLAWVLGRYDRPFAERPVVGKLRWLSSARTRQKLDLDPYLAAFGG